MLRFLFGILFAAFSGTALAGDFYAGVGTDGGPTGNNCSAAEPCTLREAISQALFSAKHNRVLVTTDVQLASALTVSNATLDFVGIGSPAPKILGTGNTGSRVIAFADSLILLDNLDIESGAGGVSASGSAPGAMVLTLADVILSMNISQSATDTYGGGLYANGADVTLRRVRFDTNLNNVGGGVFAQNGSILIEDCTFHGNLATGAAGGISIVDAATTIRRTTVDGSQAGDFAGGIFLSVSNRPIRLENVTVTGNTASNISTRGAGGLAISYNNNVFGQAHVTNVTLVGNSASGSGTYGTALDVTNPDVHFDDSIVQGTCASGGGPSATHIIESPGETCLFAGASAIQYNISAGQLALGALANNGGSTQTILPDAGSVAVNAGAACPGEDQRGLVRNVGACDIGAVEVGATLPNELFASDFEP